MQTEGTKDKGEKAESTVFGYARLGQGIFERMNKCCTDRGGIFGCSGMIKEMMEKMKSQP